MTWNIKLLSSTCTSTRIVYASRHWNKRSINHHTCTCRSISGGVPCTSHSVPEKPAAQMHVVPVPVVRHVPPFWQSALDWHTSKEVKTVTVMSVHSTLTSLWMCAYLMCLWCALIARDPRKYNNVHACVVYRDVMSCAHTSGSSSDTKVGDDIDVLVKVMCCVAMAIAFLP